MIVVATLVGAGLLLILIELFLIPGTTVVGFIGFFSILVGIYFGYSYFGIVAGSAIAISSIAIAIGSAYYSIKIGAWEWFSLKENITGKVNQINEALKVGDEGITVSALRPCGEVIFDGKSYEVHSEGEFIDANVKVKIIQISATKLFVQPII